MSWLSRRETSRVEDMAYCMLGLFGINMPLLYGEGNGAFDRLQLEIIRKSADESIFAWGPPHRQSDSPSSFRIGSILASHPAQFAESGNVRTTEGLFVSSRGPGQRQLALGYRPPYSIKNKGLKFRIPPHLSRKLDEDMIEIPLACYRVFPDNRTSVSESCDIDDDLVFEVYGDYFDIFSDDEVDFSEYGGGICKARRELLALQVDRFRDENPWQVLDLHNHIRPMQDHDEGEITPFMDMKWPAIYLYLNFRSYVV